MQAPTAALIPPAGAGCAAHPDAQATFVCARCGSFGCPACHFGEAGDGSVCRSCAERGLRDGIPWEIGRKGALLGAFWTTSKSILKDPTRFFRTPQRTAGPLASLGYGVVAYTVGQLAYALFIALIMAGTAGLASSMVPEGPESTWMSGYFGCLGAAMVPLMLFMAPVQALLGIVVSAAGAHGTLALLGSAQARFEQTLRAVSYANAPYLLFVVPCLGPLIALAWVPSLEVIALREAHGITTRRAMVAAFGWRLLLTLLIVGAYVALFATMFAAAANQQIPR